MPQLFVKAFIIFFALVIAFFLIFLLIKPKILVQSDKVTLVTPQLNFYIPSNTPLKVYKFNPNPLELTRIIEKYQNASVATLGVYVKNLSTGQEIFLNPDEQFSSASLYKLAVMYTLFQKQKEGKITFNDNLTKNLHAMVTYSSNEAALALVDNYSSWKEIDEKMHEIGLKNTNFYKAPLTTTPRDIGKLLELMSLGETIDMDSSISMLKLLSGQKINDRIPVLIPAGVIIAHKTGELEDVRHDAGVLIGPDNDIVMVLMSKDSKMPETVKPIMSGLAFEIYEFFRNQWATPPEIL